MNNKLFTLFALTAIVTLSLVGCDSDLTSLNNSPNAVSDLNVNTIIGQQSVLVGMQAIAGDWYSGDRSRLLSIWTRQMCAPTGLGRPQPAAWNTYTIDRSKNSPDDYTWFNGFHVVKLADDIIYNAASAGMSGNALNLYLGVAKFYKALALGETAALYGSIPVDIRSAPKPAFVSQSAAYAVVQSLLSDAITNFQAISGTSTEVRELNFQGNAAKWIAAANSLRARYYLHQLDYANAANAATSGITAAANTVNGIWTLTAGEYAPWGHWTLTETGEPLRANKYYVDFLRGKGSTDSTSTDTRIAAYLSVRSGAVKVVGNDIYGDLGGTGDEVTPTKTAGLVKYAQYNSSFPLISYQENILVRAEAAQRVAGSAVSAAALADLNTIRTGAGLPAKLITDFANGAALITEVLKQKYIQLFLEGQAYHDMRRVNQTDGTPLYRTGIPLRFLYPESETSTNPNVPADPARNELW